MTRPLRVLVTAGPTVEPVDAVRVLSNRSTGAMGYAVAAAAVARGHRVTLVSGPTALPAPCGARLVRVQTARQMLAVCRKAFARADALVMAAAVSDHRPARPARFKRRKGPRRMSLALLRNPDVLATLAARKGKRAVVGFALENDLSLAAARAKMRRKRCDAVVVNALSAMGSARTYRGALLSRDGARRTLGPSKAAAGRRIILWVEAFLSGNTASGGRKSPT